MFFENALILSNDLLQFYKVAYRIVKYKKPHTIVKELILLVTVVVMNIMVGESAGYRIHYIAMYLNK